MTHRLPLLSAVLLLAGIAHAGEPAPSPTPQAINETVQAVIARYELPGTRALNFVMKGALAGGVSMSLRVDGHGKSFQSLILEAQVPAPTA